VTPEYLALLHRYASGDHEGAIVALGNWRSSDLDLNVQMLQRRAKSLATCATCRDMLDELPLRAAVMLHTDRDRKEHPPSPGVEQARPCPGDQARRASQIAAVLATRPAGRDFARRFFLGMAQRSQWDFCLEAAVQWSRDGLERFPGDAELLLSQGAALEERGTFEHGPEYQRRSYFENAERALSAAAAAGPALLEPVVRLGHVQFRLDKNAAALETLERAVARGGDATLLYLAHIFLGQARERAGRSEGAIEQYRLALVLDPESQAAAIALSHALLARGNAAEGASVLQTALSFAGRRARRDPHWDYVGLNAKDAEALFDEMRAESRQ
jgi:tetratricopeptide (TPR) repeat protein